MINDDVLINWGKGGLLVILNSVITAWDKEILNLEWARVRVRVRVRHQASAASEV